MQLHNKEKLAYYSALTILLSYAELMLPHFLPFLKYGLGNIVVLLALNFAPLEFLLLLVLKSVASSFVSGILFTPFFLLSLSQSISSGFVMYFLFRIKGKWLSITGISLAGAAVSAIVQIYLAGLYLGNSVHEVLWLMLCFSIATGFVTAYFSQKLQKLPDIPELKDDIEAETVKEADFSPKKDKILSILSIFLIILTTFIIFSTKNLYILFAMLAIAFIFQRLLGKKIFIMPHIFMWIFIIIFGFSESSTVEISISKAAALSTIMAFSQGCSALSFKSAGIVTMTLNYFSALMYNFEATKGNFIARIKTTFESEYLTVSVKKSRNRNFYIFFAEVFIFVILFLISRYNLNI